MFTVSHPKQRSQPGEGVLPLGSSRCLLGPRLRWWPGPRRCIPCVPCIPCPLRPLPPAALGIWRSAYSGAASCSFPACSRFQGNKIPQARAEVSHLNGTQANNRSCSALFTAWRSQLGGPGGPCSPPRLRRGRRSALWQAGQLGFGVLGEVLGSQQPPSLLPPSWLLGALVPAALAPSEGPELGATAEPRCCPRQGWGAKPTAPRRPWPPLLGSTGRVWGRGAAPGLLQPPQGGQALPDVRTAGRCRARVPLAARVWAPVGPPPASVARGWLRSTGAPSPINSTLYFYNQQRVAGCVLPTPSPKVLEHPGVALGSLGCVLGEQTAPTQPPASSLPLLIPILQQEGLGCRDEPQRPIPTLWGGGDTEAVSRRLHPAGTMRVGWDLGICPRAQGRWQEGPAGFPAAGRVEGPRRSLQRRQQGEHEAEKSRVSCRVTVTQE